MRRRISHATRDCYLALAPSHDSYPLGKSAGVDPSVMPVVAALVAVGEQIEKLTVVVEQLAESAQWVRSAVPDEPVDGGGNASTSRTDTPPIEELAIGARAYNCLKRYGIDTVGELVALPRAELAGFRNLGKKSLEQIELALALYDLTTEEANDAPPSARAGGDTA
jgi:DNA-directed RNA polymerase alpha subunit